MLITGWVFSLFTYLVQPEQQPESLLFELRHLHAVSNTNHILFSNVPSSPRPLVSLQQKSLQSHRPPSFAAYSQARQRSQIFHQSESLKWQAVEITAPNVESRETLLQLAKMADNAYFADMDDPSWYALDPNKNWRNTSFGWEPNADGLRGQIFATPDNSTVVLAIKGTSTNILGNGAGPTVEKDKVINPTVAVVASIGPGQLYATATKGQANAISIAFNSRSLARAYIMISELQNLYNNLTFMYPSAEIWIIGHSLGAALASLLGATFGAAVVGFESPGERLAARRLHLPSPPSLQNIFHVYHTADPIAMGVCNGLLSSCTLGGYAMESRCHLGKSIIYDTVSELSWSVDIRTHGIVNVIEKLLSEDWKPSIKQGREVPVAVPDGNDCVDCYAWEFTET